MMRLNRLAHSIVVVTILGASTSVHARGVSPYLPLNLAPEIERDIERVLILADQPTLLRPIPAARVLDAMGTACSKDAALCARVRRFLNRYMHGSGIAHAEAEISSSNGAIHVVENQHGATTESNWRVSTAGYAQLGDYILVNGGVVAYDGQTTPTGSMLSLGFDFMQLDVGYRDHWLSPFTDSAMLMSTEAPTMPSITLSNYAPLTGLGLSYEVFLAEMSESSNIAFQNRTTTGKPRLAGLHLGIEPAAGWSLSGNRVMQFGGGERGGRGVKSFFNALFKPHEYDNTSSSLNSDQEFGNQVASWTSKMIFPGRVPFAVYFEYAGEDSSYSGNYRLGNSALSMGVDFPRLWEKFDLTYEASEWQNGWYVHSVYGDGLRNESRVIGHWFGDARALNDGVGGQSHMVRLGWEPWFGGVAEFKYRTIKNEDYGSVAYTRAHELNVRYSYPWRALLLGGEVEAGRDVFGERYSRIAAFARFGNEFGESSSYGDADSDDATGTDYFVDLGGSAHRVRIELADGSEKYATPFDYQPHIGLGARRSVSEHSDLGARIEFDRIEDQLMIAVRALDYRYRWGRHIATSFFAGAARLNLATPAFGYYGGFGAQWRELTHNLDLGLDIRYGDKIARDKLLPTDPAPNPRPDMFYDLFGASLYVSYRL